MSLSREFFFSLIFRNYYFRYGKQPKPRTLREKIWGFEGEWKEDICGVCNDMGSCMDL